MNKNVLHDFMRDLHDMADDSPPLTSQMELLLSELRTLMSSRLVHAAFEEAIANVDEETTLHGPNPWKHMTATYFVDYFRMWFTFLPRPGSGLGFIVPFTWFYLNNMAAYHFLNEFRSKTGAAAEYTPEIFHWQVRFVQERGRFMDSSASLGPVRDWMTDPSTKSHEFVIPKGGFRSFNEIFTRALKVDEESNPRPISEPDDDRVIVSPADAVINWIMSDLTLETSLDVKGRRINVNRLLGSSKLAPIFVGGTAVSCVLTPNVYHHFHSPVTGEIVEGREIPGVYNGIVDGRNWFSDNYNIGAGNTEFSIFEDFHRSYFIFRTKYGYCALVPVGLNTISKLTPSLIGVQSTYVEAGGTPVPVKKGQELGHFAYGGSLNIMLFQKGMFSATSLLMGQRLGLLNPKSK